MAVVRVLSLEEGERIRVRGQTRGTYYTVVGRYNQSPVDGEWVYIRELKPGFELGGFLRKVASGSIVRIGNEYYRIDGYTGLGVDGATLRIIGFWEYESLGLPPLDHAPPRPPNAEERRLMAVAEQEAEKEVAEAEQLERHAKKREKWRLSATCHECGRQNYRTTAPDEKDAWFLKYEYDEQGERWACPEGEHRSP